MKITLSHNHVVVDLQEDLLIAKELEFKADPQYSHFSVLTGICYSGKRRITFMQKVQRSWEVLKYIWIKNYRAAILPGKIPGIAPKQNPIIINPHNSNKTS